jgi:aryl-alcohol dehydrogenase-like predicted oxidoreductase
MERNAHAVLDAAYAQGVRYFDAARSYGKAEAFLASWLDRRSLGPSDVTVGSKWGYTYVAEWRVDVDVHETKDLSAEMLQRQLGETQSLLGRYLRLYQIHSATLESGVLNDRAVLDELRQLRANGLHIGFSVTGPRQAETIERARELDLFDAVQATWNPLEQAAGSALAAAHGAGLMVIVKEALANGLLTTRGAVPLLAEIARDAGVSPDALVIAAALTQPWADVVLSGAVTMEMVRSNLVAVGLELDAAVLERLLALRQNSAAYWQTRATLPWN